MATKGNRLFPTPDKRKELTCALCIDVYRDPKLLPCAHSFCQKCLEDLIQQHPDGTFPCPVCRKETEILSEGASGFHTNPYIDEKELERARDDTTCSLHEHKKFDIFCVDCDLLICGDCKQSVHLHHKSQILQNAKKDADEQLSTDKVRLREMKEHVEQMIPERGKNLEEYRNKKAAVERKIRDRHATLVVTADQYLKKALESLEEICSETEDFVFKEIETAQRNVKRLAKLGQKIVTADQNGEDCKVVNTALEMRTGYGSECNVRKMKLKPLQSVSRVVHLAHPPTDYAVFVSMKNFIGRGQHVTYSYADPEVSVKQEIQCGSHADSVVFCVCPDDEYIHVSFEPSYKDPEPYAKKFSTADKVILDTNNKGRHSYRSRGAGKVCSCQSWYAQSRSTYVKCSVSDEAYMFDTYSQKKKYAMLKQIVSEEPLKYADIFRGTCGLHRAASICPSQYLLAVVEESNDYDGIRQVKLFKWNHLNTHELAELIDTYESPLCPCQPADVCFYTSGAGEEVLLIADELNDAIHVTDVNDDCLTFSHFLAPGCPLLVQPTALNTDHQGQLWVGCRGGTLLTVEPLPSKPRAVADAGKGEKDV